MTVLATPAVMPAVGAPPALTDPPAAPVAPVAPAAPAAPVAPVDAPPAPPVAPIAAAPAPPAPWGDDENYDAPRAARLIANLRAEIAAKSAPAAPAAPAVDVSAIEATAAAWQAQAVTTATLSKAAEKFVDAPAALALAGIGDGSAFVDGTTIDETKIAAALDAVAEKHPVLLKQQTPNGFRPNRGQAGAGAVPVTTAQIAANAEAQQDWKTAGTAKANQLLELHKSQS